MMLHGAERREEREGGREREEKWRQKRRALDLRGEGKEERGQETASGLDFSTGTLGL